MVNLVSSHDPEDTDAGPVAIHHTLGWGPNQAAPGAETLKMLGDVGALKEINVGPTAPPSPTVGMVWINNSGPTEIAYYWDGSTWADFPGVPGPPGADGADGATGPPGIQGEPGPAGLPTEPVIVDWFDEIQQVSNWEIAARTLGTETFAFVADATAPTAKGIMRVTVPAGGEITLRYKSGDIKTLGLTDLYRHTLRVKLPDTFVGWISAGFIGYNGTGTIVDSGGGTNVSLIHTPINQVNGVGLDPLYAGYLDYVGYNLGRSDSAVDDNVPVANDVAPWNLALLPSNLCTGWRPAIRIKNNAVIPYTIDIDAIEIYRLDSSITVPDTVYANEVQADLVSTIFANIEELKIPTNPGDGKVLTSDPYGVSQWLDIPPPAQISPDGTPPAGLRPGDLWINQIMLGAEPMFFEAAGDSTQQNLTTNQTYAKVSGWKELELNIPCDGVLEVDFHCWTGWVSAPTAGQWTRGYIDYSVVNPSAYVPDVSDIQYMSSIAWGTTAARYMNNQTKRLFNFNNVPADGVTIRLYAMMAGTTSQAVAYYPRWIGKFFPGASRKAVTI